MGIDDKVVYNATVHNGQAIIANDNATITATNNVGIDRDELKRLISEVRATAHDLSEENQETVGPETIPKFV